MNFYIKRFIRSALTFLAVVTITFVLTRLMPGGPVDYVTAQVRRQNPQASEEQINAMVQAYIGVMPDKPLYEQYIDYFVGILQFDLGQSFFYGRSVTSIYAEAIPWTLFILGTATLISFIIAVALGAVMAYEEGTRFDFIASTLSIILNSVPYYIAAIVFIAIFVTILGWLPSGGRSSIDTTAGFNLPYIVDVLKHAAMPIASVVITGFGGQALGMRGNSISVLGKDYIRVARLRMLPTHRIAIRYVAHNAILPIYTGFVIGIAFILGGSVILEEIFNYPGVGYYFFASISSRDYPLMMGGFIIISTAVVIAVVVADMTYGFIDPRASAGGEASESY
ncbi:ABC transporter permease [Halomontanus rarus]|uniref:ABC transporter permease n=1 Tax=Halomontanus rarus TaxID=3034020 RepID=UPI00293BF8F5|nr:ABC transporter permease [Halovivax sp. KZCA124]